MSDTVESVAESGPSTGRDATLKLSAADVIGIAANIDHPGQRPAAYAPRLKTESLTRPPLMYQSANITKLDGFAEYGTAVAPAVSALDAMAAALTSVIEARGKSERDPTLGAEGAQVLKVAAYADSLMTGATQKYDTAHKSVQSQIDATEAELNKSITSSTSGTLASEIRAHCKAQKSPSAFVSELMQAGDEQGVSAILGAPSYLSGITDDMRKAFTRQWHARRNPQLTGKLALLNAASDRLDRAGAAFLVTVEKAMGVDYRVIKRLRDAAAAASF